MKPAQVEAQFRHKQSGYGNIVAALLGKKQDEMVEWKWCSETDLKKLGAWHLMSAELVIADLLRQINIMQQMGQR